MPLRCAVRFFGCDKFLDEFLCRAGFLARFPTRDVFIDSISNHGAGISLSLLALFLGLFVLLFWFWKQFQHLPNGLLGDDAERGWELCAFGSIAFQLGILGCGE